MGFKFNPFTGTLDHTGSSSGSTDTESVQDIIGAALVAGPGITIVYDDPGNAVTISSSQADLVSYSQYGGF